MSHVCCISDQAKNKIHLRVGGVTTGPIPGCVSPTEDLQKFRLLQCRHPSKSIPSLITDIEAAKFLGWASVGAIYGYCDKMNIRAYNASHYIEDVKALTKIILGD